MPVETQSNPFAIGERLGGGWCSLRNCTKQRCAPANPEHGNAGRGQGIRCRERMDMMACGTNSTCGLSRKSTLCFFFVGSTSRAAAAVSASLRMEGNDRVQPVGARRVCQGERKSATFCPRLLPWARCCLLLHVLVARRRLDMN
jgi:hypothetical protein